MVTPSPVPDSFLAKVLSEFGLQWTHLAIFSGIAFSTFGLDKYLNTGAWMLTAIASFALVFLFRREVSGRFPLVCAVAFPVAALAVGSGYYYANGFPGGALNYMASNKVLATVFLGLSLGLPLATAVLSYRQREDLYGGSFPKAIREAIQDNLADLAFFKRNQLYDFRVLEVGPDYVKVRSVLSYTIVNRTASEKVFTMTLTPMRDKVEYLSALVDGRALDTDNPSYRTEHGLQVTKPFPAKTEIPVRLEVNVWYRAADSDLLASYLPTTDFELIITNPFPELRIVVECLFRKDIPPEIEGTVRRYRAGGGTVPYQGFKLDWMPKLQMNASTTTTGGSNAGLP